MLLHFEVRLAHLERDALFRQRVFLLYLPQLRLRFLHLAGRDTEVQFPLHPQHWCHSLVLQAIIDKGVFDAVTIGRLGDTPEDPKEEHGIVVSFRRINELFVGFHALTRLRKFRPQLAGIGDVLLQGRGVIHPRFQPLVGQLNGLRGIQTSQGVQPGEGQSLALANIVELFFQLALKRLQLEQINIVDARSAGLELALYLVNRAAQLVADFAP